MSQVNEAILQPERTPFVLGRPAWGKFAFSLRALQQHRDAILRLAEQLEAEGGGLLVIPHTEAQEPSVLLLLSLLGGHLRRKRKSVRLCRPVLEPYLTPEELFFDGYLLVHRLPQMDELLDLLEGGLKPSQVVIATGIREEWEQLRIALPCLFYSLSDDAEGGEEELSAAVQAEQVQYQQLGEDDRKVYRLVALFDAWGIPLPFELLARALGRDEDEVGVRVEEAQEQQLLFWIDLERPPALLVSTKAPAIAWGVVSATLSEAEALQGYTDVIQAVNPQDKGERYTIIKLLQALLRGSYRWDDLKREIQQPRRQWLSKLLQARKPVIRTLRQRGDTIENLLWGKIFEELQDFEESDRVFQWGLELEPENIFLLHARAKMLGEWAQVSRSRYAEAKKAFEEAARRAPENAYIWQAWGVMEAERRNAREARGRFKQAEQAARRDNEKIYTWVAWANLEVEEGKYSQAAELLEKTKGLASRNPYVPYVEGKKAFYEGHYDAAKEHLNEVLRIDPVNVRALNTLGDMAAKRGHWVAAEQYFARALKINPENCPTLHALGELWAEQGTLKAEQGKNEEAQKCYQEAEKRFQRVLELEEKNLRALVAYGVLLGKWARLKLEKLQEAEAKLRDALERDPQNKFALHALGELKRQRGEHQDAERLFHEVLGQDRLNLPALLALADLKVTLREKDEAQRLLRQVAQIIQAIKEGESPSLPQHELIRTYNAWAKVELEVGNQEKAEALVRDRALSCDPENTYTCRTYAAILERLGKPEEARTYREKARTLAVTSAQ